MTPTELKAKALELVEKAKDATPGEYETRCREFSNHALPEIWTEYGWADQLSRAYRLPIYELFASCSPDIIQELMTALVRYQGALEHLADAFSPACCDRDDMETLARHYEDIARAALKGE